MNPALHPIMNPCLSSLLFSFALTSLSLPLHGQPRPSPQGGESVLQVHEVRGQVTRFDSRLGEYIPVTPGFTLDRSTLLVVSSDSSFIFSDKAGIAGRVSENTRIVLSPAEDGTFQSELRLGTIAVYLDPERPEGSSGFAVRTSQGVTSAIGTFFAVTEYKGQTYSKVKKGTVQRKTIPPGQPDFAAYLRKSKTKAKPVPPKPSKK